MGVFNDTHTLSSEDNKSTTNVRHTLPYQSKVISASFKKTNTLWFDVPEYTLNLTPTKALSILKLRADINISNDGDEARCFFRWRVEVDGTFSHNIENDILDVGHRRKSLFSYYSPFDTSMMTTVSNTSFIRVGSIGKYTFILQVLIVNGGYICINKSCDDANEMSHAYSTSSISVEELGLLKLMISSSNTIMIGNQD